MLGGVEIKSTVYDRGAVSTRILNGNKKQNISIENKKGKVTIHSVYNFKIVDGIVENISSRLGNLFNCRISSPIYVKNTITICMYVEPFGKYQACCVTANVSNKTIILVVAGTEIVFRVNRTIDTKFKLNVTIDYEPVSDMSRLEESLSTVCL